MLGKIMGKFSKKNEMISELQQQDSAQQTFLQRKKTPEERELEGYLEVERQKDIKSQVEKFRAADRKKILGTENSILGAKNVIKGKTTVLKNNQKMLGSGSMFFGDGNIMKGGAPVLKSTRSLF